MIPDNNRALIVEDSRTIASIVRHYLQLEGFEVLVAADGVAGLETARRERPRVIVTDLNMPGMGGLDMVRALRADAGTRDIAILMLTSDENPETEQQAMAAGADEYILKPVDPQRLAARVRAVVDGAEGTS
jgi:two-component system alkaline phosphatase synthesis response regulator PhoP